MNGGRAVANTDSVTEGKKIIEQAMNEFGSVDVSDVSSNDVPLHSSFSARN